MFSESFFILHAQASELVAASLQSILRVGEFCAPYEAKYDASRSDRNIAENVAHFVRWSPAKSKEIIIVVYKLVALGITGEKFFEFDGIFLHSAVS